MPARWMQQKLLKMKRMRRSYMKKYPTSGVDVNKINAYEIFQNKARVRTVAGINGEHHPIGRMDTEGKPILDNAFMHPVPVKNYAFEADYSKPLHKSVFNWSDQTRILEVWSTDRLQGTDEYLRGPLLQDFKGIRVWCYFCGAKYLLLKEAKTFIAISIVYDERIDAYEAFLKDRIIWNHHEDRPS